MHAIGIQSEIVTPVLENLLQLYDYNWEHIEADNFRVLTDAIFDDPEPKGGHKRQANERINLDSDHYNKKPRIKPTSKMNVHDRRELAEAPLQQEVGKLCHQIVCQGKGTGSKSRLPIKERNMEIEVPEDTPTDEDSPTVVIPLAVMPPQAQDSSITEGTTMHSEILVCRMLTRMLLVLSKETCLMHVAAKQSQATMVFQPTLM